MSKKSNKPAAAAPPEAVAPPEQTAKPEQATAPQQASQPTIQLKDDNAATCYANFCRVTGTPEELILDFGLNSQPYGQPTEPIEVTQRLVVNYYTAKRMLQALHLSVQRHEQAFGALETDIQKRIVPSARAAASD